MNKAKQQLGQQWHDLLGEEFEKPYMQELRAFLRDELKKFKIYPPMKDLFRAFSLTPPSKLKVVILGQDPYHNPGQAHGLSFSVPPGKRPPPSLLNIFTEIKRDMLSCQIAVKNESGDLTKWAKQGVLLLNAILTVRENSPASHREKGWEVFTEKVIEIINSRLEGVVFMLWGAFAQKKASFIDHSRHLVLQTSHPSSFSVDRGFRGCSHFSKANNYLSSQKKEIIDWST